MAASAESSLWAVSTHAVVSSCVLNICILMLHTAAFSYLSLCPDNTSTMEELCYDVRGLDILINYSQIDVIRASYITSVTLYT